MNTRPRDKNRKQIEQADVDKQAEYAEEKKKGSKKKQKKNETKEPDEPKSCFSKYSEDFNVTRNSSVHVPIDVYDQGRIFFLPPNFDASIFVMLGRTFSFF